MSSQLFTTGHMGRKVEKIRKLKEVKQETLANAIGVSRQTISKLEASETIDDEKLQQIAEALEVTVDAIKNYNEEATVNYIQNNWEGSNKEAKEILVINNHCSINPLDKCFELIEENKKLYQLLLESEKEKVAMLLKQLESK